METTEQSMPMYSEKAGCKPARLAKVRFSDGLVASKAGTSLAILLAKAGYKPALLAKMIIVVPGHFGLYYHTCSRV